MSYQAYTDPIVSRVSLASLADLYEAGIPIGLGSADLDQATYLERAYDLLTEPLTNSSIDYDPVALGRLREAWRNTMGCYYEQLRVYGASRPRKWNAAMRLWVLICTTHILIDQPFDPETHDKTRAIDLPWIVSHCLCVSRLPILEYPQSVLRFAIQTLVARWCSLLDPAPDLLRYLYLLELRVSMLVVCPERGEEVFDEVDWRACLEWGANPMYGPNSEFVGDTCAIFRHIHNALRTYGAWERVETPLVPGRAWSESVTVDGARTRLHEHIELVAGEKKSTAFRSKIQSATGRAWIRPGESERFQRNNFGEKVAASQLLQTSRPFSQVNYYQQDRFTTRKSILTLLRTEELWVRDVMVFQLVHSFFHSVFHLQWERAFVLYANEFEVHADVASAVDYPLIIQSFQSYDVVYWHDCANARPPGLEDSGDDGGGGGGGGGGDSPGWGMSSDEDDDNGRGGGGGGGGEEAVVRYDPMWEEDDGGEEDEDRSLADNNNNEDEPPARVKVIYSCRDAESAVLLWCWFVWTCMDGEPQEGVNIRPFLRQLFDPVVHAPPEYHKNTFEVPM